MPGEQVPARNRVVDYRLTAQQAKDVNDWRTAAGFHRVSHQATGAKVHHGNAVAVGDTFPMMIVRVWGDTPGSGVNGQVFLDGNDTLWVTSAVVGEGPGTWSWPVRT